MTYYNDDEATNIEQASISACRRRRNIVPPDRNRHIRQGDGAHLTVLTATGSWLLCDGSSYSTTENAGLYNVNGYTCGGDIAGRSKCLTSSALYCAGMPMGTRSRLQTRTDPTRSGAEPGTGNDRYRRTAGRQRHEITTAAVWR
jgi:hypothetical protein